MISFSLRTGIHFHLCRGEEPLVPAVRHKGCNLPGWSPLIGSNGSDRQRSKAAFGRQDILAFFRDACFLGPGHPFSGLAQVFCTWPDFFLGFEGGQTAVLNALKNRWLGPVAARVALERPAEGFEALSGACSCESCLGKACGRVWRIVWGV